MYLVVLLQSHAKREWPWRMVGFRLLLFCEWPGRTSCKVAVVGDDNSTLKAQKACFHKPYDRAEAESRHAQGFILGCLCCSLVAMAAGACT